MEASTHKWKEKPNCGKNSALRDQRSALNEKAAIIR